jgi:hypothetical protein
MQVTFHTGLRAAPMLTGRSICALFDGYLTGRDCVPICRGYPLRTTDLLSFRARNLFDAHLTRQNLSAQRCGYPACGIVLVPDPYEARTGAGAPAHKKAGNALGATVAAPRPNLQLQYRLIGCGCQGDLNRPVDDKRHNLLRVKHLGASSAAGNTAPSAHGRGIRDR